MRTLRIIGGLLLAVLTALPAVGWQDMVWPTHGFHPYQGKPEWRGPNAQPGNRGQRRPHIGQWLRKHFGQPEDQQLQSLRNDPEFQKLPPDRQEHLIKRLHEFNELPPQQRQRMLARMDAFNHLTPEQQHQAREIFGQVRQLPDARRDQFRKGMRQLAEAPAEQRATLLDSNDFRNNYTDHERDLMRQIMELNILPSKGAPEPPPGPPPAPPPDKK